MSLKFLRAALLCLAASACVTTPPPAVTSYSRADCPVQPDLAAAQSLTPGRPRASFAVTSAVGADTPCVRRSDGSGTPYVVFALPTDYEGKTVAVGSTLELARIFSPDAAILDAQGVVTRTLGRDQFMYRGNVYSAVFRPRAGETYLLVTADPARIGQQYNSIAISTNTTSSAAGGVYFSWTSGVDAAQSRMFSYEGAVVVTVSDSTVGR